MQATPAFQATPGELVGERFRLVERLGKTPNADTWRALDSADSDAPCVVKLLGGADLSSVDQLRAFDREARVLKSLAHPGIPVVRAATTDARGAYVLALDEVPGLDLTKHIQDGPRLARKDVMAIARDVLGILDYLHTRSPPIFHRDIKPSNIVRRHDGTVVLVDFGAVCDGWRAEHTIAVGTLGYMAPEQLHGQVSPRSDLFALGATLLHLATGRPPSECVDRASGVLAIPDGIELDPRLHTLIDACIRGAPSTRPQSAEAALALLDNPIPPLTNHEPAPQPARATGPVKNAINLPPAPRDPLAIELTPAFDRFAAVLRAGKGGVPALFLLSLFIGMILLAIVLNILTADIYKYGTPIAASIVVSVLIVLPFVRRRRIVTKSKSPDGPIFAAFRDSAVRDAIIVNIERPEDPEAPIEVELQWVGDPTTAPISRTFSAQDAETWAPGQRVPFLTGPDDVSVAMLSAILARR